MIGQDILRLKFSGDVGPVADLEAASALATLYLVWHPLLEIRRPFSVNSKDSAGTILINCRRFINAPLYQLPPFRIVLHPPLSLEF